MKIETIKKHQHKPRVLIAGSAGIGKTTFAANSPDYPVLILSLEEGARNIGRIDNKDVDQVTGIKTWQDFHACLDHLIKNDNKYKTIVIDSLDFLEKLCHKEILRVEGGNNIASVCGGYGGGYRRSEAMHLNVLDKLKMLNQDKNCSIILTAHCEIKTCNDDPDNVVEYDTHKIRLHKYVEGLFVDWCDAVLFGMNKRSVAKDDGGNKGVAINSKRYLICEEVPTAKFIKNRFKLKRSYEFKEGIWDELTDLVYGNVLSVKKEAPKEAEAVPISDQEYLKKQIDLLLKGQAEGIVKGVQLSIDKDNSKENLNRIITKLKSVTGR